MSRAFVREADGDLPEDLPAPLPSPHPNRITPAGLAGLRQRLAAAQQRVATATSVAERAQLARQAAWLEARVTAAIPVLPPPGGDRVGLGASVTVEGEDGSVSRWRIVGEDEAAPERGWVSWVSPLAQALEGASVGDVVTWTRPAGELEIEVRDIRYDE